MAFKDRVVLTVSFFSHLCVGVIYTSNEQNVRKVYLPHADAQHELSMVISVCKQTSISKQFILQSRENNSVQRSVFQASEDQHVGNVMKSNRLEVLIDPVTAQFDSSSVQPVRTDERAPCSWASHCKLSLCVLIIGLKLMHGKVKKRAISLPRQRDQLTQLQK